MVERFTEYEWIYLSRIFKTADLELFQDLNAICSLDAVEEFLRIQASQVEEEIKNR